MRLTRLFVVTTGVLLTLVSVMLARSVMQDWHTVSAAQHGLQAMGLAHQAIRVAELASFERGPTNAVLGDSDTPDPARRTRLATAREASDKAIAATLQALADAPPCAEQQAAAVQLVKARAQLARARQTVDRVAAMPLAERTAGTGQNTKAAIGQMFGVIDTALEAVTLLSADAERAYPELSLSLAGARLAAELREYAGRVGSQFTAALAARRPLGAQERRDIPLLVGRIEQLRKMIEVQARANPDIRQVASAIAGMEDRYFANGLPFIASMAAIGTDSGDYGLDPGQFAARYVPEMASIVTLRDALFDVAREGASQRYAQAQRDLAVNAAIGGAVLLIEITVFLLVRQRILKPLLANTRAVVAIAEGKLDTMLQASQRTDEIGDMQNAVAELKKTAEAKRQLEVERESLIRQLQHASSVDYLTGLLNRREFTARAHQQLALARRRDWPVAMVVFDIDHFKSINDRFGHTTGDAALVQIASIAQLEFRATDILARYGGEEFVALITDCDDAAATLLAERLRAAIASARFVTAQGKPFDITSSFGLATARANAVDGIDTLFQQADKALYEAKAQGRNRVNRGTAISLAS